MKRPKMKVYNVDMDMNVSIDYNVKARTASEAKQKAFKKLKSRLSRKWFNLYVDKLGDADTYFVR
jgi:hypothetical protein